jgi:hypothetical protein
MFMRKHLGPTRRLKPWPEWPVAVGSAVEHAECRTALFVIGVRGRRSPISRARACR